MLIYIYIHPGFYTYIISFIPLIPCYIVASQVSTLYDRSQTLDQAGKDRTIVKAAR